MAKVTFQSLAKSSISTTVERLVSKHRLMDDLAESEFRAAIRRIRLRIPDAHVHEIFADEMLDLEREP